VEDFAFNELGSTGGELAVAIWCKIKKKEARVGVAVVPLIPIRPGEIVEEWFPVFDDEDARKMSMEMDAAETRKAASQAAVPSDGRVKRSLSLSSGHGQAESAVKGEVRLRIRYDRLSVLPTAEYGDLKKELNNLKSLMAFDLVASNDAIERLAENLVRIYMAQGKAEEWLHSLIEQEVRNSPDTQTLFRGNTIMTKSVDAYMKVVGWQYMDETVGGVVRWICDSKIHCELDPERVPADADLVRQTEELTAYATILWKKMEGTRETFPDEMRVLFGHIQQTVMDRFGKDQNARYTSVSGFLFLRLFCPAILSPRSFELVKEHPDAKTQRTLTLLAKLIQSLGNLQEFGAKEHYMMPMNAFIRNYSKALMEFIDRIVIAPVPKSTGMAISSRGIGARPNAVYIAFPKSSRPRPAFPARDTDIFYPPMSPFLIDLDRELAQLVLYVNEHKKKLVSGGESNRANGTPRSTRPGRLEHFINVCEQVHDRVSQGRREGFDAGGVKKR
jgi:hypothetical protein